MWGEYNAGSSDTTKGHCIRKPYLCCVTFGCAGEVGWIPADTQSAPVRGTEWILNVWFEVRTSASAQANGTLLFLPCYAFECSAWAAVEASNSAWTCVSTLDVTAMWIRVNTWRRMVHLYCSMYMSSAFFLHCSGHTLLIYLILGDCSALVSNYVHYELQ